MTSAASHGAIARVLASIAVGSAPEGIAVDAGNSEVYVANTASNNVSVIAAPSRQVVATVPVGPQPFGITYDAGKGEIFVATSPNVSVISDATNRVVATVGISDGLRGAVYDPGTGEVYVASVGNNALNQAHVYVISDSTNTVVATIQITGSQLYDLAYDPATGRVLVANYYDSSLAVISDATHTVVGRVAPIPGVRGVTYDSGTKEILTANWGAQNLTRVSGANDTIVGSVGLGSNPRGVAYDSRGGMVFVTNEGSNNVSIISDTSHGVVGTLSVGSNPRGIAYDLGRGELFVANQASNNVSVLTDGTSTRSFGISFFESGLPSGTNWSVTLDGVRRTSLSSTIGFTEPNGTYTFSVSSADTRYHSASTGTTLMVSNGPVEENLTFGLLTFPVAISEAGLPSADGWYFNLSGGLAVYTHSAALGLALANGSYTFSVATGDKRYEPVPSASTLHVAGANLFLDATFSLVTSTVSFGELGLPNGTSWGVSMAGSSRSSVAQTIAFDEANGTYPYSVGSTPGFRASVPLNSTVTVRGAGVQVTVTFAQLLSADFMVGGSISGSCKPFRSVLPLDATATGEAGPFNFTWDFGPTSPFAFGVHVNHTFTAIGDASVTLWIADSHGVNESVTKSVLVSPRACGATNTGVGIYVGAAVTTAVAATIAAVTVHIMRRRRAKLRR
ncbi:MAG: YncE family protein [Thermoplasmata archaeon]|nr:YncE family protein [Thermoplasmata archaeon]